MALLHVNIVAEMHQTCNLTKGFFRLTELEKYSNHISTQAEESSRHQPTIHALVAPLGRCRCKHLS